jgi:hypothetical protein
MVKDSTRRSTSKIEQNSKISGRDSALQTVLTVSDSISSASPVDEMNTAETAIANFPMRGASCMEDAAGYSLGSEAGRDRGHKCQFQNLRSGSGFLMGYQLVAN